MSTSLNYEIPIEKQLPMIADAGFTHISLGAKKAHSDYSSEQGRRRLRKLLKQNSLHIDTIHGPRADHPHSVEMLTTAAEAAADLSARVVVFHAGPFRSKEWDFRRQFDTLMKVCRVLEPVSEKTGVIFALENVFPGPANDIVRQALCILDPQYFGFCYDSSHDQIGGPRPFDLLAELSDRLMAVHLSDRSREFVDHIIPGEGFINWTFPRGAVA